MIEVTDSTHPTEPKQTKGPSRREFLTRAAALAGTAAVLGTASKSSAKIGLDPNAKTPKSGQRAALKDGDPIRIGVIGVGGMGTGHVHAMLGINERSEANVQVVALCDVCEPRWQNALIACNEKQTGVETKTYVHHEDLLARDDIHGVVIASTEHWHAGLSIDAIAAGKDVYCEKPMTLRLPEALHMRQVVKANPDIIVQVGTQQMMRPKYQSAKKLLAEGAIGKPTFSQTSYCRNSKEGEWLYYKIDPAWEPGVNLDWDRWCGSLGKRDWDPQVYARWRRYKDYSTGIIGDLLVHVMTPMMYALDVGWPTRVVASGGHYVDDIDELDIPSEDIGNDQDALRRDWLNSIRTREPNKSQVDLAAQVMVAVDLASQSMWTGKSFGFDPTTMRASAL